MGLRYRLMRDDPLNLIRVIPAKGWDRGRLQWRRAASSHPRVSTAVREEP